MRIASTAAATALTAVVLAAVPLTAAAETAPYHTATVEGVAEVPISSSADQAAAIAAYRAGLSAAVADALSKAQFLAAAVGTTVATELSPAIVEGSGYINCPDEVEYTGHQPDWGSSGVVEPLAAAAPRSVSVVHTTHPPTPSHKSKSKKHKAKKSSAGTCTLSTSLTVTYILQISA